MIFLKSTVNELIPYAIVLLLVVSIELIFGLGWNLYLVFIFAIGFFAIMIIEKIRRDYKKNWINLVAALIFALLVIWIATVYTNII
ncbi:hypothetical protein [Halobacillus sp. Marseille-Q1614]|uniref:hypothetical protein n=1 Tax=Halobacillus sp. Marseille-Q1614 TaxID=2709134 RepID=UPI0015701314|nr:hypothetical protein [Halobacillus sp. Marseille-Q1614]